MLFGKRATQIAVINRSSVLTDSQVRAMALAVQKQVTKDWEPVWGSGASLHFVGTNDQPPSGLWQVVVLDTADVADALGYHDITEDGQPLGKVFAKTSLDFNEQVSGVLSHEVLEMLADPGVNRLVVHQPEHGGAMAYAYEVGDPVQDESSGYEIDGMLVSDFAYPDWFIDLQDTSGIQFDHTKSVSAPFEIAKGGYMIVSPVKGGLNWTQIYGDGMDHGKMVRSIPHVGARRERRMRRDRGGPWITSDPK